MDKITLKGNGKLNLSLNVLGKSNVYHTIESVVTTINMCDYLTATKRLDNNIIVNCRGVDMEQNIATKVARAITQEFNLSGVTIDIDKRIPFMAGLGGSSVDGALTAYAYSKLFNLELDKIEAVVSPLASDIVFLMRGGLGILYGRGNEVKFVDSDTTLHFALISFPVGLSTKYVYDSFDTDGRKYPMGDTQKLVDAIIQNKQNIIEGQLCNHLQNVALNKIPVLEKFIADLAQNNIATPHMTGSGSSFFILASNEIGAKKIVSTLLARGYDARYIKSQPFAIEIVQE